MKGSHYFDSVILQFAVTKDQPVYVTTTDVMASAALPSISILAMFKFYNADKHFKDLQIEITLSVVNCLAKHKEFIATLFAIAAVRS